MLDSSLAVMGRTKRVDPERIKRIARLVRELVDRDFDGNQTAAAKALGVSQGHVSHVARAADRGPGLPFLIALREYTGRSIDWLLGFEGDESDAERLARRVIADAAARRAATVEVHLLPPKKGSTDAPPRPRRR